MSRNYLSKIIVAAFAAILLFTGAARANLTIIPSFTGTLTNDPNSNAITNTILQAIAMYQATFSDNVTVFITFTNMSGGLGESSTALNQISYSQFRSHLASDATTIYDTNALAHLPAGTTNPVNNVSVTDVNLAEGRALGFSGITSSGLGFNVSWTSSAGSPDGIIFLNTSIMNLSRASTNASKYDLLGVVEHETDEVLCIGSALSAVNDGDPFPTSEAAPEDFFRYDQNGNRSFTTNASAQAYFSLDGKTLYAQFNENFGGDYNDWFSFPSGGHPPRVQDAYATPGATPDLNVELITLDALGYNLIIPKMTLTRVSKNVESISWTPSVPGFLLTENTNLATTNWVVAASNTNNPALITNNVPVKFFRFDHP